MGLAVADRASTAARHRLLAAVYRRLGIVSRGGMAGLLEVGLMSDSVYLLAHSGSPGTFEGGREHTGEAVGSSGIHAAMHRHHKTSVGFWIGALRPELPLTT